jgi:hypothetical protein
MKKMNGQFWKGFSKPWFSGFFSNLLSVIIGITITFGISFLIEQHKEKAQIREMIGLVQEELKANKKWFESRDLDIAHQIATFKILLDNEDTHWKNIPSDSLVLLIGETRSMNFSYRSTNSWDLFRSSELFQKFPGKGVLSLLSACYFMIGTFQHDILEKHYYIELEKSVDSIYEFYEDNPYTYMESLVKNKGAIYFFRRSVANKDYYHDNLMGMCALIDMTLDVIKDSGSNYRDDSGKAYELDDYLKKYKEKEEVETSVHKQLEQFPESRLQDLYKNFFQDRFGPGHLIPDSTMAGNYLREELASYSGEYLPLVEEIGWEGNFVRVSTDVVKNGMLPYSVYLDAFIESANTTPETPIESWQEEWHKILTVIDKMNLNLPDYETDKSRIQDLINSGAYAMHHSEAFERAYEPHYRIIKKEIFLEKIKPYLSRSTSPSTGT